MTDAEQREAARQFVNKWKSGGDEKQDCHPYWLGLLQNVLGVENAIEYIQFEKPVKLPEGDGKVHTRYIDGYIQDVKVLIEQKGSKHPLDEKEPQSGGEMLTPYEQGKRYNDNLPISEKARWIVTCNFIDIWIYDMDMVVPEPQKIELPDLQTKFPLLDFLVKKDVKQLSHEMEVSIKAGDIVGLLYDAFLKQYGIPETAPKNETDGEKKKREHKLRSLNALCVRLVFCLYAEDAGIFGRRDMFHDYMEHYSVRESRRALIELFKVMDTPVPERDEYLEEDLAEFPYVNGGLFADESIEIPQFNEEIRTLLLKNASEDFNWRDISPTIFGAVFESTLNPETRRSGGMHYTSIENIHKVIDLLFLDDLKAEFKEICAIAQPRTKKNKLDAFQNKLASIRCLDASAGSGNFLTESYLSLRRLENEVLQEKQNGQMTLISENLNPIQVSIQQFYGIEINDFAVTVAKTALWIAESQMLEETKSILYGFNQDFLPLKTYVNITEGNALRLDWNDVVPKEKLTYIIGNPPFVGGMYMSTIQKKEIREIFDGVKGAGEMDYVCAWYKKACDYMSGTGIHAAFVSTNSICQGEQVTTFWKYLFSKYPITLNYAYTTFVWNSEANDQAKVHCVIIGFSLINDVPHKRIIDEKENISIVEKISPYLTEGDPVFIESHSSPLCDVPKMRFGSMPRDGGGFVLTPEEKEELEEKEPLSKKWIHRYVGATEFLNNKDRYCLWLVGADPLEISKCPTVKKRVEYVRNFRAASKAAGTRKFAETPTVFCQIAQPDTDYIIVPKTSSGKRRYIPIGFMSADVIASDLVFLIPNADLYEFGILMSNVHNAWMRQVAGRLKSDYRYSKDIVYNDFAWPEASDDQKENIKKTAQGILDARKLYPNSTLASLYDPLTMPPELRKAHTRNDIAVMQAYGFSTKMSEADCVTALMDMYQKLNKEKDQKHET